MPQLSPPPPPPRPRVRYSKHTTTSCPTLPYPTHSSSYLTRIATTMAVRGRRRRRGRRSGSRSGSGSGSWSLRPVCAAGLMFAVWPRAQAQDAILLIPRNFSGVGNNVANPSWGSVGTAQVRRPYTCVCVLSVWIRLALLRLRREPARTTTVS